MKTQDAPGTHPTLADSGDNSNSQEHLRGSNLGRYVIIEPIGSGGMGTVYRAYDPQLNRGVALKILSVKQADFQAAERAKARLIREAQALAQLSHPNVVAVHDAGNFEDDVFIAMELVKGKTLDSWMKEDKRSVKEILEVIIAAGRGLSAAHKAGLIHRDFKPGNVIVGDDGRVRVLDFGLARAADQLASIKDRLHASGQDEPTQDIKTRFDNEEIASDSSPNLLQSPLTNVGGVLGTPLYMAPEQLLGLKTDERTDQFGFCVVLYEALYGKRPFAGRSMEQLKSEVIRQQVCIPRTNAEVPAWLWKIVYKGLSVKPEDRHASIDSLLEDLEKDPEEQLRQKWLARRRKTIVCSLIVLVIALPIGVWYGLRYRTVQLCMAAESEFGGVWDDGTKSSIKEAFLAIGRAFSQGTWERVERIFDKYKTDWMQMRSEVCEARILRATLSEELFDLRMSCLRKRVRELRALVKVFAKADPKVVQEAVQASSSLAGAAVCADEEALRAPYPSPKTTEAATKVEAIRAKLVQVSALQKTAKYVEGMELAKTLEREARAVDYRPVQAEVLQAIGEILEKTGEYKKAEDTLHDVIRFASENRDGLLVAKAMTWLVRVVGYQQARHEEALFIARDARAVLRLAGGDERTRASLLNNMGAVFWVKAEYGKALEYLKQTLKLKEKVLGPEHLNVASTLNNIGLVLSDKGDYAKAMKFYSRALTYRKKALGSEHPQVAATLSNIGRVLTHQGQNTMALKHYREVLVILEKGLGREHPHVAFSLHNIGIVFNELKEYDLALEYFRKSLAIKRKSLGPSHPQVAFTLIGIGEVCRARSEHDKVLKNFRQAVQILEKTFGREHPLLVTPLTGMGDVLVKLGKSKQALMFLERAISICKIMTCQPEPHGRGLFWLARASVTTDSDKNRATSLANKARKVFGKNPNKFMKQIGEIDTWLQQHGEEKR